jgi:recombinational DNA repair ATPase RecF
LAEAEAALNAAVREHTAWREAAPDEARLSALKRAAEAAAAEAARAAQRLNELAQKEAGIEGELRISRADDVEARVAELSQESAAAAARVGALDQEIAALQLIASELEAAEGELRDRFVRPVLERLSPYVELVFPAAEVRFGDGLAVDGLKRANGMEALAALSDGTKEQLAVLARLGLGRLLADTGTPLPLVLDDALVYADDDRIERMFDALKLAAASHQVLVLTCRSRTFEALGGNRVALSGWSA